MASLNVESRVFVTLVAFDQRSNFYWATQESISLLGFGFRFPRLCFFRQIYFWDSYLEISSLEEGPMLVNFDVQINRKMTELEEWRGCRLNTNRCSKISIVVKRLVGSILY